MQKIKDGCNKKTRKDSFTARETICHSMTSKVLWIINVCRQGIRPCLCKKIHRKLKKNILQKSICPSVLRPNLAHKKSAGKLQETYKHKKLHFGSRLKGQIKSNFNMFSRTKKISFQNNVLLPKYYDTI